MGGAGSGQSHLALPGLVLPSVHLVMTDEYVVNRRTTKWSRLCGLRSGNAGEPHAPTRAFSQSRQSMTSRPPSPSVRPQRPAGTPNCGPIPVDMTTCRRKYDAQAREKQFASMQQQVGGYLFVRLGL